MSTTIGLPSDSPTETTPSQVVAGTLYYRTPGMLQVGVPENQRGYQSRGSSPVTIDEDGRMHALYPACGWSRVMEPAITHCLISGGKVFLGRDWCVFRAE